MKKNPPKGEWNGVWVMTLNSSGKYNESGRTSEKAIALNKVFQKHILSCRLLQKKQTKQMKPQEFQESHIFENDFAEAECELAMPSTMGSLKQRETIF